MQAIESHVAIITVLLLTVFLILIMYTQQTMTRVKDVFEVSFAFHEVSIGLETCFMRVLRVSLAHFLKRVSLKPN